MITLSYHVAHRLCRYNVMLTILTYFLPICAMGYAYFQVGVELWGSQGIGECTDHQMENVKSKRRVNIFNINNCPRARISLP